ncbi:MAG: PQQ-binding-like beta-propeller repeat protein [Acidobacteriota bacterium]|nr:PQQ-binding-like beta-propeller repeat protein [Acidobacteriota bacterium]
MKSKILLAALLLPLPAVCQVVPAASPPSAAAHMFRGNPEHTGVYDAWGVPQFHQVKWKFPTHGLVISSPAIDAGTAYVGSTNGNLYAVVLASGAQKWKFKTGARITSSPAVAQGTVYVGSYDGKFYAVDSATGTLKWKFQTAGEHRFTAKHIHGSLPEAESMPDPFDFYLSSPTLSAGAVYFGSGDGNIYSLDAASGKLNWKFQTGDVVHASPAVSGGTLYVGSWDSYFYALDAATGKEKWRFKTGEDAGIHNQVGIQSSAAVADGIVYFGCRDSNFYALDAATGEKKWVFNNKGSWVITSPAVYDGRVYFGTSDTKLFYGFESKSGGEPLVSLKFTWPIFSSPAIAGDTVYFGSHDGTLYAIDLKTAQVAWSFKTDGARQNLAGLSKPDGTTNYEAVFTENFYEAIVVGVNKLFATGAILSSPVVAGDSIYFGSTDGNLYALN